MLTILVLMVLIFVFVAAYKIGYTHGFNDGRHKRLRFDSAPQHK